MPNRRTVPQTAQHTDAVRHLRRVDKRLREVIDAVGPCTLKPRRERFAMLARAIIAQQISVAAAKTINARVLALVSPGKLSAEVLLAVSPEQLRAAGVSQQKAAYLRDLAERVTSGDVRLAGLARRDDEAIIADLVRIKGIGRWTAQMFLIFSLGRPDVLAEDDLGLRSAMQRIHAMPEMPTKVEFRDLAAAWTPYSTVASWYCWRSADLKLIQAARKLR
jgi:DNA-3-methyladenine glycosylase II